MGLYLTQDKPVVGWTDRPTNRLSAMFPDRELFMRSQGKIRFIKISSRFQQVAVAVLAIVLIVWAASLSVMVWNQYNASSERNQLLARQAQVAIQEERQAKYAAGLERITDDLVKRQEFLEAITPLLPDDMKTDADATETIVEPADATQKTATKIGAAIPEATGLAHLEARQIAFTERLTRYADRRAARAADAIRKLGLDPDAIARNADMSAMGGPLEALATAAAGAIDPRFERLGTSMARMSALERSLDAIPQVAPAHVAMITSSFGYRRDPFTGAAAMHSGLDFRGPRGAPIYAAAKGRVSFVGIKSGYGKTVEISHGNGLMTRYAHMSRFDAAIGQRVDAGAVIGGIGSTGRSTGPHLHFEVRINGRAVNPRPFLENAPEVLKEARSGRS